MGKKEVVLKKIFTVSTIASVLGSPPEKPAAQKKRKRGKSLGEVAPVSTSPSGVRLSAVAAAGAAVEVDKKVKKRPQSLPTQRPRVSAPAGFEVVKRKKRKKPKNKPPTPQSTPAPPPPPPPPPPKKKKRVAPPPPPFVKAVPPPPPSRRSARVAKTPASLKSSPQTPQRKKKRTTEEVTSKYCLFCYKPCTTDPDEDKENEDPEGQVREEVCRRFYSQMQSALVGEEVPVFPEEMSPHYNACDDCFYVINAGSSVFRQIESLKGQLEGHLRLLCLVMKSAGKVTPRVKEYQQHFHRNSPQNRGRKGKGQQEQKEETKGTLERVLEMRKGLFKKCAAQIKTLQHRPKPSPAAADPPEIQIVDVIKREVLPPEEMTVTLEDQASFFTCADNWSLDDTENSVLGHSVFNLHNYSSTISTPSPQEESPPTFPCGDCTDVYATAEDLEHHQKIKHLTFDLPKNVADSPFGCLHCPFKTALLETLVTHEMEVHTAFASGASTPSGPQGRGRRSACARCPEVVSTRIYDRAQHYIRKHNILPPEEVGEGGGMVRLSKVPCPECPQVFKGFSEGQALQKMKDHQRDFHLKAKAALALANYRKRKRQQEMKEPPPPPLGEEVKCLCLFCGRRCLYPANCEEHLRAHVGEKPFWCSRCPSEFPTKNNLQRHSKLVHGKEIA